MLLIVPCWWCFLSGILACLDGYMNIAMEQTEEYVDGQLKTSYGDAFIRGNNGEFLESIHMFPTPFLSDHAAYSGLIES